MVKLYAIRDDRNKYKSALQMIGAWATTNELVLGQSVVDKKSNEITAIPELLNNFNILYLISVKKLISNKCDYLSVSSAL